MPRSYSFGCILTFVCCGMMADISGAENWPQWRGPTFNGISVETDVPTRWDADTNVAWKVDLPGPAGATPVVWGERIFVSSVDGQDLLLICISTEDGAELWRRKVARGNKTARGDEGNSASPSPACDAEHVYVMMGSGDFACYTHEGEEVWKFDVEDRFGKFRIQFGMTSTPVLYNDRLLLQLIHGDGKANTTEARVAAIDTATGSTLWDVPRITGAYAENEHSYASPMLYDHGGLTLLLTHGADYTIAYDPADGSEAWRLGGLNPQDDPDKDYHRTLRFVSSPCPAPGIVVSPTAKNGPIFAVRPDVNGDVTADESALRWVYPRYTPDVPSPLVHDGVVYLCREDGKLLCLDQDSGEQIYYERTHNQRHRASPVYADGHIYLSARDGHVTVVKSGRDFEVVAENDIDEALASSPAISNGTIYLRTFDSLWAIRE
ncbi:outer membrane protein assembly factor BamB family protein [Stratiformator vulcanicus]|uniref:Outer membrane biogenesis protein BamB n=1 Tax=Stratiformator vulcanicus TaxID=2527980 RepID=A0A517R5K0_9PLAN|nr:PQQ-binding-like beta-propeller repeat protein [Stratiformator vulcanicus]QDT39168.1 outer membrane biogenesis protein BamB [Stratiformator vulcanicus]